MDTLIAAIGSLVNTLTQFLPVWNNQTTALNTQSTAINNMAQAVQNAVTTPPPAAPTQHRFKMKQPQEYDGDVNRINGFLQECEVYMAYQHITDYKERIYYILSLIRGGTNNRATIWADGIRSSMLQYATRTPPGCPYTDWQQFKDAFIRQFGLFTSTEDAIIKIKTMEQGQTPCEEYSRIFETYAALSGYNNVALLEEYKRGLNPVLRNRLLTTYPLPADGAPDVNAWANRACELDRNWRKTKIQNKETERKSEAPKSNYRQGNKNPTQPTRIQETDPNAMDVDRTRRSSDVTCYHCQKKGHIARNCPDKDKPKVFPARGTRVRQLWLDASEEEKEQIKKDLGF